MNSQPKPGVLIELVLPRLRISGDFRLQKISVTLALRGRGVGVDDRLHHSARAENRGWTKRHNVTRGATLSFVRVGYERSARLKLFNMVFENRFGQRNESADVTVRSSGTGLDVAQV